MIVFSTAVAGSDRIKLEETAARIASKNGKKLKILNFIDEMIASARELNKSINPANLPNLDIKTLEILKTSAFHKIIDKTKEEKGIDYIIDGHVSFWWKGGPINLLNLNDFKELDPDFFISIAVTPYEVMKNLKRKKEWTDKEIDEYEIAVWSELEIYTADLISDAMGKKNYLIGSKDDPSVLYDLVYSQWKPKIYMSYTMANRKEGYARLNSFIKKLRKHAIVFDPKAVDINSYNQERDWRIKRLVFNQTVRRDYHLIDQSDIVVVHLSELVYSSGVDSERMHAHTTGKTVLLYFPFETYSPFTPYFVDKMYKQEEEIISEVAKLSRKRR
ncbi:ATP-binding protein [Candidatus Parvarchaeota archaeon]|nr:ATP-binding protein [Candidatus Parvarchaeota archaeon]